MSTSPLPCMLCGSPCAKHTFVFQCNGNDCNSVLEDIRRLNEATEHLHLLKVQHYRQLNVLSSSMKNLPNEILLSIFRSFCDRFHLEDIPQFILGSVCSHWRNLINTEPQFWRSMELTVDVGHRSIWRSVSLLEVFKERNGAFFEFLAINCHPLYYQRNPVYEPLLSSIRGVSKVWRADLECPPYGLLEIMHHKLDTYNLSLSGPDEIYLEANPNQHFVPSFTVPWLALTHLTLARIRVDFCVALLLGCPNLIQFTCRGSLEPTVESIQPNTLPAREVHFPKIQRLIWHHRHPEWDYLFLSFYRFPTLQYFSWHGLVSFEAGHSIQPFTSLLPRSCHTFHLAAPVDDGDWLTTEILQQIANPVERLVCSDFHMSTFHVALERLEDPTFIPSLTFFKWEQAVQNYLDYGGALRADYIETTELLKKAIQGRKRSGVGRFRMEVEDLQLPSAEDLRDLGDWIVGNRRIEVDPGFSSEDAYEFMTGEFNFEIAEDGCWVISF